MVRRVSFKDTAETDSMDTAFQGHPTPNFALPGARALIEGSAQDPQPPHRNRAYGHGTSPQRGRCSPVRCLSRRPQAQGAPNTTDHSAAAVVGSDRALALNASEMASWKVKSGCACTSFVTH